MPALPAVPQVIRIAMVGSFSLDLDVVWRFYMAYTGTAPTDANLVTFAGSVGNAWNTDIASLTPDQYTLTGVDCIDLTSATAAVGQAVVSHAGTRGTGANPASAAALVNLKIARRYRGGKPRLYIPAGVNNDVSSAQTWTTAFQTAMNTGFTNFITAVEGAAWSGGTLSGQVNVSYYEGHASVQNPVTLRWRNYSLVRGTPITDPILAIGTNIKIGTQRRRISA